MLKQVLMHHYLREKIKKVSELMKDELDGKIMKKRFVGLRAKNNIYWYWSNEDAGIDAGIEDKKAKCTKNVP